MCFDVLRGESFFNIERRVCLGGSKECGWIATKGSGLEMFERDSKKTSEIRTLGSDEQQFESTTVDYEDSEDEKTKGCVESIEFKLWLSRKC